MSDVLTVPVLAGQASIWAAEQFGTLGHPYNNRFTWSVDREGGVAESDVVRACEALIDRHLSMSARMPSERGVPIHILDRRPPIEVRRCGRDDPSGEATLSLVRDELAVRDLDLAHGPLTEMYVLVAQTHIHVVGLRHHCVNDGLSHSVFTRDLQDLVEDNSLEPVDDFFAVMQESLELEREAESTIAAIVDEIELPLPHELMFPCDAGARSAGIDKRHHEGLADRIRQAATQRGVTRMALTTAGVAAAVAPYAPAGWQMGTVVTTRPGPGTRVAGCFVNTVPLVMDPEWATPSVDTVEEIHQALQRQLSHRHVPIAAWTRELRRRGFEFPTPERFAVSQFTSTGRRLPEPNVRRGARAGIAMTVSYSDRLSLRLEYPHKLLSSSAAGEILDAMSLALQDYVAMPEVEALAH